MEFNPYNPYTQDYERTENERLEEELLDDEIRAEAQKTWKIDLDEKGNEIDPSVQEFLDERNEESWTDNGNQKES